MCAKYYEPKLMFKKNFTLLMLARLLDMHIASKLSLFRCPVWI